jgi:nitrate/TMAO reductase-like tetraheme cytochrome c subunit
MVPRKVRATNELYHWLAGSVNTKEKFEAKRLQLANYVWQGMRDNDSRECRNCHAFEFMDLGKQTRLSDEKHKQASRTGKTCIDCHMGIAHNIANNFDADGKIHDNFARTKRDCSDCHKGMARAPD